MRPRSLLAALTLLALGYSAFATAQGADCEHECGVSGSHHGRAGRDHVQPVPRDWADGPPPPGFTLGQSEVAIIQGDPTKEGAPFVIRIRSPLAHKSLLIGTRSMKTSPYSPECSASEWATSSMSRRARTCPRVYIVMPKGMHHFAVARGRGNTSRSTALVRSKYTG